MKPPAANDRRLFLQIIVLALLTLLPITMIAVNGARAMRGIFAGPNPLSPAANRASSVSDQSKANVLNELPPVRLSGGAAANNNQPAIRIGESDFPKSTAKKALLFGVFDPEGVFENDVSLKLRHLYVSWANYERAHLMNSLTALEKKGFQLLLTIEPWPIHDDKADLLSSISAGKYDKIIDDLASILNHLSGPVYVSWGHEMDQDLNERYPWSGQNPEQFVKSYRYVVDQFRRQVKTELRWVWAGVQKNSSRQYWPGDQYADYIGMPIYSLPIWDQQHYGYIRDFQTTFLEKFQIVKGLGKPLMITELGVSGSPDFESYWLHQTFMHLGDYADLAAIVFFYSRDTEGAWGNNVPTPDWRVHPGSIRGLVNWNLGQLIPN